MTKKKGGNEIAFRPQSIIEARFNLKRRQNDVLDLVFGMVGSEDDPEENTRYTIKVSDAKKLYDIKDQSNAYKYLIEGVKHFKKGGISGFQLQEDNDTNIWYAWFTRIAYYKAENEVNSRIELDIHPDLKKMIIQSKQGSYYRIEYSMNLESKYSKRIYYYLADHKNYQAYQNAEKGVFRVEVKKLMDMLQCPQSFKYGNFKQKALDVAYEEINGSTDIAFEYKEIQGKSAKGQPTVVEIQFKVKDSPKRKGVLDEEISCSSEEVKKIYDIFGCSVVEAESLYNTSVKHKLNWDETMKRLKYTLNQNTNNKVGYALHLLSNDFSEPQSTESPKKKSNTFNNFDGRKYSKKDIEDIEKNILAKTKKRGDEQSE